MRIIRTEVYFDPLDLTWPFVEEIFGNPGVSMAFFNCETDDFPIEELHILFRPGKWTPRE